MNEIDYFLKITNQNYEQTNLILVANVDGITTDFQDYSEFSLTSEFLSELEVEELTKGFQLIGFNPKVYYDELHFIKDVLTTSILDKNKYNIVVNMAQKGANIGRKSLIPSFCDINNIPYVNSNPYVVSLCRNKLHSGNILTHHGFSVPESWLYDTQFGWLNDKKPPENHKVIIKLNHESASIGLDENNVINFSSESEHLIEQMSHHYKQEIIIQQFIEGFEVECPFLYASEPITLPPLGISINNKIFFENEILTYVLRGTDNYKFYDFESFRTDITKIMTDTTKKIATTLGIRGFGRVDYRINKNGNIFVTDLATSPHIVKHSSFHKSFQILGYSYEQMLGTLVGITLSKITKSVS
ncbi:hypothetical protein [Paenibacillus monticola]|uniref:ATP-grasp domain-containing protein n=1 Tax=Paenibacillus monticola TaxID=2666075 RepID=A0A7X2H346_9BACL|nr:hypothetical protein [Paenibacillus monticola]MRN52654.1 hypothetical protein [Paenibacillus monticola]